MGRESGEGIEPIRDEHGLADQERQTIKNVIEQLGMLGKKGDPEKSAQEIESVLKDAGIELEGQDTQTLRNILTHEKDIDSAFEQIIRIFEEKKAE